MDLSHLAVDNLIQTRTLTDLGLDAYGIRALGRAGKLKRCSHGWYAVAPVDGPGQLSFCGGLPPVTNPRCCCTEGASCTRILMWCISSGPGMITPAVARGR